MSHFVTLSASLISGWAVFFLAMHSIASLTVLSVLTIFLRLWLPRFIVAALCAAELFVSHLVYCSFHVLCTLLLHLFALTSWMALSRVRSASSWSFCETSLSIIPMTVLSRICSSFPVPNSQSCTSSYSPQKLQPSHRPSGFFCENRRGHG
ncbi:hypothetical protein ILYODFUR_038031 [Ilyodon furcidens]|uniref:Secreted peptide n=1 Tax=Ilyodon furcidens TaxID=33524 RepID=A0ABV0TSV6_9TELE